MDDQISQSLQIYSRQLTAQLKDKEGDSTDLQRRFSKLQCRFAQLDYAFKNNLQLHRQQMIEIHDLRLSEKELRKVEKDRWKKFCKLEDQLVRVTNEKDATKNGLVYWKQAVIDQKKFYEGKLEECLRECKLRMEADASFHQWTLRETQNLSEKHIQEMANRCKLNEEEGELTRKKAIMLQGDVDVLSHRMEKLACLIENSPEINGNLQAIGSCMVKVLRSLNTPDDEYDKGIRELHQELQQRITCSVVKPEEDYLSDYEMLKSQNLVLREVVKKLKNELTKVQKNEVTLSKPLQVKENQEANELRKELIELISQNKNLYNLLVKQDADLRQLEIESKENMVKLEEMNLELIKSKENKRQPIFSKTHGVKMDKEFICDSENGEGSDVNDDKSQEAYWKLKEKRVKKFKEQSARDLTKSVELNFESLKLGRSSGENYVKLKDKQKVEDNTAKYLNVEKNTHSKFKQGPLEPIESHLNSIQYKEYTIPLSRNRNLKIRHPIVRGSTDKLFRVRSVHSEKEYQSTSIDETVLYFDCENDQLVLLNSKMINCAVQTVPISTENSFTQTKISEKIFNSQANTGVKILHSERQAIERSIRNLEKTVSEASEETLGLARSLIINTNKFPPSEEFFDCIRYLSQFGNT